MKKTIFTLLLLIFCFIVNAKPPKYYELRVYHCYENKLPNLLNRFKNHTRALFEKHGIENVAYFKPTNDSSTLVYLLAYKNKVDRETSWQAFANDPEWKKVESESEINGKIVKSVENRFLTINKELNKHFNKNSFNYNDLFEMRIYHCLPGRYSNIVARFKNHTRELFEKHNIKNVVYFDTDENNEQSKLLYFVKHQNQESAMASWKDFGNDPEWVSVRDASEKDGKIIEKIDRTFLKLIDFNNL